jgi:hypothetical protein
MLAPSTFATTTTTTTTKGNAIQCASERGDVINQSHLQRQRPLPACRSLERETVWYITNTTWYITKTNTNATFCQRCCRQPMYIFNIDINDIIVS